MPYQIQSIVTMSFFESVDVHVCVHTTGLASPSALQSPVASKPKNGSLAISKPQEGQPYFSIPLPTTRSYPQVTCYVTVP